MRDIVAALEWVRHNIGKFGGDPSNVTVMGQSGGGSKVRFLMGAPSAEPLFEKAVVMSGTGSEAAYPNEVAKAVTRAFLDVSGLTPETIGQVDTMRYHEFLAKGDEAVEKVKASGLITSTNWRPKGDSNFMPADPSEGWSKYASDKPMLSGSVMNETLTVNGEYNGALVQDNWHDLTYAEAMQKITAKYVDQAEALSAAWTQAYPNQPLGELVYAEIARRAGVYSAADIKATQGSAPDYSYFFAWNSLVIDGVAGAWHISDVPMALYTVDMVRQAFGGGEAAWSTSFDIACAFIIFVRDGNPYHPGLPHWPACSPKKVATLILDDYSGLSEHGDRKLVDIVTSKSGG